MAATIHQPGHHWSPARRRFRTRNEGHNLARKVWICRTCRAWHDPPKPAACAHCGGGGRRWSLHFDSRGEAVHFLSIWIECVPGGRVRNLRHHPRYPLVTVDPTGARVELGISYEADLAYDWQTASGEWTHRVEDFKPKSPAAQDPAFKLKRRIFEAMHNLSIRIIS